MQKNIDYRIRLQAIKYRKIVNIMGLLKIGEKQNKIIRVIFKYLQNTQEIQSHEATHFTIVGAFIKIMA